MGSFVTPGSIDEAILELADQMGKKRLTFFDWQ
jgi:hypothetical protein